MIILGIESSCDETAASVVQDGSLILSNTVASQIDIHKQYGGVVPEIASRNHLRNIIPVIQDALQSAHVQLEDLDGVAVTQGPGLIGSLVVGINAAKAIAYSRRLPLVGVNHLEGHLLAPLFEHPATFPNITLVVSGGHTNLYLVRAVGDYTCIGMTRDDAAGEAFDKVATMLDFGYPGGVVIDKAARKGNPAAFAFPRPMINDNSFDFSFSGLKTAVLYHARRSASRSESKRFLQDTAASFQAAVAEILTEKTIRAARQHTVRAIAVAGGVAANSLLRTKMHEKAMSLGIPVHIPSPILCTDNAAMIALAGHYKLDNPGMFPFAMNARSRWPL